jgi:hypothetical protein
VQRRVDQILEAVANGLHRPMLPTTSTIFYARRGSSIHDLRGMTTHHVIHEIDGLDLSIVMDRAHDGTWTASWWFPFPTMGVDWADSSRAGFASCETAEQAAIAWALVHGPQKLMWGGVAYFDPAAPR